MSGSLNRLWKLSHPAEPSTVPYELMRRKADRIIVTTGQTTAKPIRMIAGPTQSSGVSRRANECLRRRTGAATTVSELLMVAVPERLSVTDSPAAHRRNTKVAGADLGPWALIGERPRTPYGKVATSSQRSP